MPYQSISPLRHRYLQRDYLGNRSEEVDPIVSYGEDVSDWARTEKSRMHEHCQSLLKAVASDPDRLAPVECLVRDLEATTDGRELLSEEFMAVWNAIRGAIPGPTANAGKGDDGAS